MPENCDPEGLPRIDAALSVSKIRDGVSPAVELRNDAERLFATAFAFYKLLLFLVIRAIVFALLVIRLLCRCGRD